MIGTEPNHPAGVCEHCGGPTAHVLITRCLPCMPPPPPLPRVRSVNWIMVAIILLVLTLDVVGLEFLRWLF